MRDMRDAQHAVRIAGAGDAAAAGALLHAFNVEFDTPAPDPDVLARRLRAMLARDDVLLLLSGDPPVALALMTFRPVVWDAGPVALLDELYVQPGLRGRGIGGTLLARAVEAARARGTETFEINVDEGDTDARRFYEARGFALTEPGRDERAMYYVRRLVDDPGAG
jgi:GNAT superfamily N-acetyltransferase